MRKTTILWMAAVFITLFAAFYQRISGPTHPKREKIVIDGVEYKLRFKRSSGGEKFQDCSIILKISDPLINGKIHYRIYPTNNQWESSNLVPEQPSGSSSFLSNIFGNSSEDVLVGALPYQPPAGKLEYYIELNRMDKTHYIAKEKPIIIRFSGAVPSYVLIPHIFLMFAAMLISNLAGLMALWKIKRFRFYTYLSLIVVFVGGMIMGPVVQKFAFGEFWTGVPFGWDLTDNKTLICFVAWIVATVLNWKKEKPIATIVAAAVTIIIFSIPHSMLGSELDPETGKIIQAYLILN